MLLFHFTSFDTTEGDSSKAHRIVYSTIGVSTKGGKGCELGQAKVPPDVDYVVLSVVTLPRGRAMFFQRETMPPPRNMVKKKKRAHMVTTAEDSSNIHRSIMTGDLARANSSPVPCPEVKLILFVLLF